LGSYEGTWEAVICSTKPAARDTAVTPATAAARLVRMGTPVDVEGEVVVAADDASEADEAPEGTGVDDCCRRW
jgi:hypothetical protein